MCSSPHTLCPVLPPGVQAAAGARAARASRLRRRRRAARRARDGRGGGLGRGAVEAAVAPPGRRLHRAGSAAGKCVVGGGPWVLPATGALSCIAPWGGVRGPSTPRRSSTSSSRLRRQTAGGWPSQGDEGIRAQHSEHAHCPQVSILSVNAAVPDGLAAHLVAAIVRWLQARRSLSSGAAAQSKPVVVAGAAVLSSVKNAKGARAQKAFSSILLLLLRSSRRRRR